MTKYVDLTKKKPVTNYLLFQMQDMPNSTSINMSQHMEDILDPDERTNDIEEERRGAEHDSEFYDGDRDQDGDTMPLPM